MITQSVVQLGKNRAGKKCKEEDKDTLATSSPLLPPYYYTTLPTTFECTAIAGT